MRRGVHLLVDMHDAAIKTDEERPPRRKWLIFVHDAVGRGHPFGRVTQERIVDAEGLGERLVDLRCVDTDGKVRDVKAPDVLATLTE